MSGIHDNNFKALMEERSFFEPFVKIYLPKELLDKIDWKSICVHKMSGEHEEAKTQKEFASDVMYMAKIGQADSFIWIHAEHQSTPDKLMGLRIINYQAAELLAYAKQNPKKKLPTIITFIYHQGKSPWSKSLKIEDLFAEPDLASQYFGRPILIDLPAMSDETLQQHKEIGPVEVVLKHVRQKDFNKHLKKDLCKLKPVRDSSRRLVLQYMLKFADMEPRKFAKVVGECIPRDREIIMSVAERLKAEGRAEAEASWHQRMLSMAKKLLMKGLGIKEVSEMTELPLSEIRHLRIAH